MNEVNEEHSKKAPGSIEVTDPLNVIEVNDLHFANVPPLMAAMEPWIVTDFNERQQQNAISPM